ncbi:MAG: MFS transporter [Microbacteriaceae bacterium]|nr:MFS transporter [Microbacteriaceae bacterium]
MSSRGTTSPFPIWRLLVLTGAIFIVVTSEFLPTGLLPDMARELEVSESQVGLLVTIFAATVVVTAVPLSSLTRRFPRKALMVVVLLIFIASNLLAAVAPNYEVLVVARVIAGATHGLFWSVTAPYASRMVPPSQLARAVSVTAAGGTAAFVLGVPFGTALGHALGWRLAFAVVGAIVLVFLILVVLFLPPVEHLVPLATGEIMVPARHDRTVPAIVIVCLSVTLIVTAQNTFSTYIVPWATQVATVPPDAVSLLLVGNGVAGAVGLLLAGWFGDTWPRASVALMIAGVAVSAAGLFWFADGSIPAAVAGCIAWGVFFGGLPSLFQARMLQSASLRLRDTASAWLTIAFNLAIGVGALVGGGLLDGLGIRVLPLALVVGAVIALVFVLATDRARVRAHEGVR